MTEALSAYLHSFIACFACRVRVVFFETMGYEKSWKIPFGSAAFNCLKRTGLGYHPLRGRNCMEKEKDYSILCSSLFDELHCTYIVSSNQQHL